MIRKLVKKTKQHCLLNIYLQKNLDVLEKGVSKLRVADQIWKLPVFVNKVLLEQSMAIYLSVVYGCFPIKNHRFEITSNGQESLEYLLPDSI